DALSIRFSADGRTIVTTNTNVVRHWDVESGRVREVMVHSVRQEEALQVISADGRTAARAFEDRIEIFDLERNKRLHRIEIPRLKELAQSNHGVPDLEMFGIAPHGGVILLRLRDADNTLAIRDGKMESWTGLPGGVGAPFFSDDGKFVAIWSQNEGKVE